MLTIFEELGVAFSLVWLKLEKKGNEAFIIIEGLERLKLLVLAAGYVSRRFLNPKLRLSSQPPFSDIVLDQWSPQPPLDADLEVLCCAFVVAMSRLPR